MANTTYTPTPEVKEKQQPVEEKKKTSITQILIVIACLSFFPLLYLIGSTIVAFFQ
ncbi:hypothetical protein [Flavilitoribacter nigricans]|uniref:hypothetical protein n=1 Tax=Flavilitoribacter nigricans TaxID=70997 RepID=UPI001473AAD0|nr:hypothetical protein [Flavilitoribacter nigricans]